MFLLKYLLIHLLLVETLNGQSEIVQKTYFVSTKLSDRVWGRQDTWQKNSAWNSKLSWTTWTKILVHCTVATVCGQDSCHTLFCTGEKHTFSTTTCLEQEKGHYPWWHTTVHSSGTTLTRPIQDGELYTPAKSLGKHHYHDSPWYVDTWTLSTAGNRLATQRRTVMYVVH